MIIYQGSLCQSSMKIHYWPFFNNFSQKVKNSKWPQDDLWPHCCWGHMCDSTQGSLYASPMKICQSMWIQWLFKKKKKLKPKVTDPKMTYDPKSVEVTCVNLPKAGPRFRRESANRFAPWFAPYHCCENQSWFAWAIPWFQILKPIFWSFFLSYKSGTLNK